MGEEGNTGLNPRALKATPRLRGHQTNFRLFARAGGELYFKARGFSPVFLPTALHPIPPYTERPGGRGL